MILEPLNKITAYMRMYHLSSMYIEFVAYATNAAVRGSVHLAAGLSVGFAGLAAGYTIGIVGDAVSRYQAEAPDTII